MMSTAGITITLTTKEAVRAASSCRSRLHGDVMNETGGVDFVYAGDLFADNHVYSLNRSERFAESKIAGAAWLVRGDSVARAHARALEAAASVLGRSHVDFDRWLVDGDVSWFADSAVARRKSLWMSRMTAGRALPNGERRGGEALAGPLGLRRFGAVRLELGSETGALDVLEHERMSFLLLLPHENDNLVSDFLVGWDREITGPSLDILEKTVLYGGMMLWLVGEFDDREAGVAVAGKPEVIQRLVMSGPTQGAQA